jgi:hypothetical protein
MGSKCSTHEEAKKHTKLWTETMKERQNRKLGIKERIILQYTLEKYDVKM